MLDVPEFLMRALLVFSLAAWPFVRLNLFMQFLSISRRRTDKFSDADFAALTDAEFDRARTLYAEGVLRQIWRRGDIPGACILWEASSAADVQTALGSLPMFKAGMLEVTVVPLQPYPGFGPRKA
jgi:muconolactone delta-isomerase